MARIQTVDGTAAEDRNPIAVEARAPAVITQPARWKYRVLKPIHHAEGKPGRIGLDLAGNTRIMEGGKTSEIAYYPKETMVEGKPIPTTFASIPGCINGMVPSASDGQMIRVDLSGVIELTVQDVMRLGHGEIEPIDTDAPEVASGLIDIITQEQLMMATHGIEGPDDPQRAITELAARVAAHEAQLNLIRQGFVRKPMEG